MAPEWRPTADDFLWELVPEAIIVHAKRHPVAVVASHVDQPWAPLRSTARSLGSSRVYDRWLAWKATADLGTKRYVEIRAEDLAAEWPAQRKALFESVGVDDLATASTFRSRSLDHRNDQVDSETRALIERALADVIPTMGYE